MVINHVSLKWEPILQNRKFPILRCLEIQQMDLHRRISGRWNTQLAMAPIDGGLQKHDEEVMSYIVIALT